jgi:hypothetical protein
MDRLFALATRLHTSLFPSADPMTASRPAPRALALPAFAVPAFALPALALLMVAAPLAVPDAAHAQATPVTTIENASDEVVLKSYDDGALLAPYASAGAGAIPAEDAGRRMMWYPGKAAFRAGRVSSDQWNDSNVGDESVAFGLNTTASGKRSTAMGNLTTASGEESMAAGDRAAAEAIDSFVWSDGGQYHNIPNSDIEGLSSNETVTSSSEPTGPNTFSVSATGGVRFITGSNSVTYIKSGDVGWNNTSTRSAKTDVTRADPTAVLEAVEAMPISTWEYKTESGEGAGTRHIGPMAEDFHGALPYDLGSSADHINSLNADGVALGAVKGLARKVNRQKETIATLKAENQDIKKRLAALEAEASAVPATAGLMGSPAGAWGLALLLGLGGLAGGSILWRRRL